MAQRFVQLTKQDKAVLLQAEAALEQANMEKEQAWGMYQHICGTGAAAFVCDEYLAAYREKVHFAAECSMDLRMLISGACSY